MLRDRVDEQLAYLESNERRHLRNFQSGNGKDADRAVIFARISQTVSGTSEGAHKGSETKRRVRAVVNKMRDGTFRSLASIV